MNAAAKLIIGLLIAAAGIYWYAADALEMPGFDVLGNHALAALKTVFFGVFGLFLILLGLLIAWIEYEDMKWEREEKHARKK